MTKAFAVTFSVSMSLFALVSVLPVNGLAQSGTAAARPSATDAVAGRTSKAGGAAVVESKGTDMRLWSFGDCDRNFPYVNAPEHQECVRVVGSDAAKDARAVHYCEVSHAKDPAEATQCKAAYFANKTEAEHEGFRAVASNAAPVVALAAPAPKRDKAAEIAALTRALTAPGPEQSAPTTENASESATATSPHASASAGSSMLWIPIMLLLAGIGWAIGARWPRWIPRPDRQRARASTAGPSSARRGNSTSGL